jgi:Raf kinase inhibitor-like YbhB/YbcL family protein
MGRAGGALVMAVAAGAMLFACGGNTSAARNAGLRKGAAMGFAIESPAWSAGETIPVKYTCDGADVSPPLEWKSAPVGTRSFGLVTEDPDAPGGLFTHWIIYNLPPNITSLAENQARQKELANGASQGRNSFGNIGFGGPCPPPGPAHRYFFRLYALNAKLDLTPGASRKEFDGAMAGHILAQTDYLGRYGRR